MLLAGLANPRGSTLQNSSSTTNHLPSHKQLKYDERNMLDNVEEAMTNT